jgi:hypothetical protein
VVSSEEGTGDDQLGSLVSLNTTGATCIPVGRLVLERLPLADEEESEELGGWEVVRGDRGWL